MDAMRKPATSLRPETKSIRSGTLQVNEPGKFTRRAWKSKGVVLDPESLTILHQSSAERRTRILLRDITVLERTDLTPHCISLTAKGRQYHFSFDTDSDLYDWQDDIYARCPLGGATSNPFNFEHKTHIGSGKDSFGDQSTFPAYTEAMMGRAPPTATVPSAPIISTSRSAQSTSSRRRSGQSFTNSRPRSGQFLPTTTRIPLMGNNGNTLEGCYFVKEAGLFMGWYWKERWLSLKGAILTIHCRATKASPPAKDIKLSTLKSIEPDPKRPNCLLIQTAPAKGAKKGLHLGILFPSYAELYTWRDAIYLSSAISADIGYPSNCVHNLHVGYDSTTGEYTGLPEQWKSVLYPTYHRKEEVDVKARRSSKRRSQQRVEPPLIDNAALGVGPGSAGTAAASPGSQFLAGVSASSDNTLVDVQTPLNASSLLVKGKIEELGGVKE